ncbi:MAG: ABC transporter substrate-binding protein [Bacteroidales bacterium]|nr:ABC transporter substrate-binding protein [Bacteroidales bacterium]
MRKFFLGILTLLLLVSCGKRQDSEEELAIFKYNEAAGILTLDPIYAKDLAHIWACNQAFNSLVAFDEQMNLVPMIAKSWDISEDGLVYTFHLRNDVQFHEDECFKGAGLRPFDKLRTQAPSQDEKAKVVEPVETPTLTTRFVTAQDFVYSFNRVVDKRLNSPGMWIFSSVKHEGDQYAFTALDDSTFQIELSQPFPPFLGILSMTYASVVPREAVDYYGDDFRSHPVGTGPFHFQYWKEGVKLVFRKNPNYFERDEAGERLPYIDAVSVSFLIDKQVAFLEFIKGKFDFMSGIDARYKDELLTYDGNLRKKYEDKIQLITEPYLNTEYFSFYIDPNDPLGPDRSRALRQAVSLCIDREKMLRYLRNGIGELGTGGLIPVGLPGYSPTIGYGYDLKRAQQLVAENHLEGHLLQLSTVADYADIGKFVQSQVEQIGLQCKMEVMPPATLRSMKANGSLPFFRSSWVADYPDAENYLSTFTTANFAPSGPNYTHYSNPKFDLLYDKAMACNDMEERTRYYTEMDSLMMRDAPVVVLFYDEVLRFVNKRVKDLGSNPTNLLDLRRVRIGE